jgi:Spy/CpxP family protein refolding chaperone
MKRNILKVVAAVAVSALFASGVYAETNCNSRMSGMKWKHNPDKIVKELGLTANQDEALRQARQEGKDQAIALRKTLDDKKQALREAIAKPGATRADVEGLVAEIKALEAEKVEQRVQGIFKVKSVLNPEQFSKLNGMKNEMGKRCPRKRGGEER